MAVALAFAPESEADAAPPDVPVERLRRRPRSLGLEPLSKRELAEKNRIDADSDLVAELAARPRDRRDCKDGPRPCPWAGCAMHLGLNITPGGAAKVMFPDGEGGIDLDAMDDTCALDVADAHDMLDPKTFEEVGRLMNMTPQRILQIEHWSLLLGRVELSVPASRSLVARNSSPKRPGARANPQRSVR
jgi:hypothetical protein